MSEMPERKPVITKILSAMPDPDRKRITFLLEDEDHQQHQFSLTAEAANQFLVSLLEKQISQSPLTDCALYPVPLAGVRQIGEMTVPNILQVFFPSGLPVTIEFLAGVNDVDALIKVLQEIKIEMIKAPDTKH